MLQKYEALLRRGNMSEYSVSAYMYAVRFYLNHYPAIDKENLLAYKGFLLENYKPKTGYEQVSANAEKRTALFESGKSSAEKLSGKCD